MPRGFGVRVTRRCLIAGFDRIAEGALEIARSQEMPRKLAASAGRRAPSASNASPIRR
jgi:hypothetical protein